MVSGIVLGFLVGLATGVFATFLITLKLVAKGEERVLLKLGAFVCAFCPLCIFHRSKPESDLGAGINVLKKACPFCLSFSRLRHMEKVQIQKDSKDEPQGRKE
jgi:hypothetical protein